VHENDSMGDAMMAEIEAGLYGLQVSTFFLFCFNIYHVEDLLSSRYFYQKPSYSCLENIS